MIYVLLFCLWIWFKCLFYGGWNYFWQGCKREMSIMLILLLVAQSLFVIIYISNISREGIQVVDINNSLTYFIISSQEKNLNNYLHLQDVFFRNIITQKFSIIQNSFIIPSNGNISSFLSNRFYKDQRAIISKTINK